jgi:hypothetical protein
MRIDGLGQTNLNFTAAAAAYIIRSMEARLAA